MNIEEKSVNVAKAEVAKFDELSTYWWDEHGPLKTLHQVNPIRMSFITDHCDLENKHILDVGCGGGILTEALATCSTHVTGLDMAQKALDVAKMHSSDWTNPPTYLHSTAEEHALTHKGAYDVVTCLELIEHVPDPAKLVKALTDLVKPGGDVFISTLNRTLKAYLMAVVGAEYVMNLIPKGTHDYDKFIKPSELCRVTRSNGLRLNAMAGIYYRPWLKEFSLGKDLSVNYLAHFQKEKA